MDLRRTLTLADRWRRRPIARRGRGGGALGSRVSPGPLGVPSRAPGSLWALPGVDQAMRRSGELLFSRSGRRRLGPQFPPQGCGGRRVVAGGGSLECVECMARRGTAKNFARPPIACGTLLDRASAGALQRKVNGDARGKKTPPFLSPSCSPQSPQTQSTPEEQLQHKRPARGRDRSRDRAAASLRDVAATAAARDRTGKRNEATAGPDAGLRAAEPPAREAGLLQRGWTFIIEAFIEPPQTYAGVL